MYSLFFVYVFQLYCNHNLPNAKQRYLNNHEYFHSVCNTPQWNHNFCLGQWSIKHHQRVLCLISVFYQRKLMLLNRQKSIHWWFMFNQPNFLMQLWSQLVHPNQYSTSSMESRTSMHNHVHQMGTKQFCLITCNPTNHRAQDKKIHSVPVWQEIILTQRSIKYANVSYSYHNPMPFQRSNHRITLQT